MLILSLAPEMSGIHFGGEEKNSVVQPVSLRYISLKECLLETK